MRLVTGKTNRSNDSKKVSIQHVLDGHSFSLPMPTEGVEEVELLSVATLLVPRELYRAEVVADLFAAAGCVVPQDSEYVLCEATQQPDAVAVVAMPRVVMEQVRDRFSDVCYTTPLLAAPAVMAPVMMLCDTGSLIYIKVYDPQLSLAEVIPAESEQEVEYLLQQLSQQYDLSRFTLELDLRVSDKRRLKSYKNRFKHILCV